MLISSLVSYAPLEFHYTHLSKFVHSKRESSGFQVHFNSLLENLKMLKNVLFAYKIHHQLTDKAFAQKYDY